MAVTIVYIIAYLQNSPTIVQQNPYFIAWPMEIFAFLFYFSNNLLYWLYSLKQWTISIEVPRQISKEPKGLHISQKCYNILKWVGIAANFTVALLLGFFRYQLCLDYSNGSAATTSNDNKEFVCVLCALMLAMVSSLFLADALRRLRKSFQLNHKFSENKTTMLLHVLSIIASQLALFVLILLLNKAVKSPDGYNVEINVLRIVFAVLLAGS